MKKYFFYLILNLLIFGVFISYLISSILNCDVVGVIIGSWAVSSDLNGMIVRHANFMRYYPYFDFCWLYFII